MKIDSIKVVHCESSVPLPPGARIGKCDSLPEVKVTINDIPHLPEFQRVWCRSHLAINLNTIVSTLNVGQTIRIEKI